jgi:surface polysaccharide O-acyltransferase-like enzyme
MKNGIRINLGLVAHIMATIIYFILVQYIVQSENVDMPGRSGIVALYLITQMFTAGICYDSNLYKKYTNEKRY